MCSGVQCVQSVQNVQCFHSIYMLHNIDYRVVALIKRYQHFYFLVICKEAQIFLLWSLLSVCMISLSVWSLSHVCLSVWYLSLSLLSVGLISPSLVGLISLSLSVSKIELFIWKKIIFCWIKHLQEVNMSTIFFSS